MKELLEKSFKNIKNGKKIINKEFSGIGLGKKFLWEPLERLLRFHPDKDIGNLEYFILRNHPRYKSQALFYKTVDQEEDTISYDLCLRCVFGRVDMEKEKKKFIQSELRSAIWNGTRLEFITNTSRTTCECCERGGKMVVDHYPVPFCDIVSGYCKYTNKKLDSIAEDDYTDFRNYHDSIASYRILCGECNSRFGNYKSI